MDTKDAKAEHNRGGSSEHLGKRQAGRNTARTGVKTGCGERVPAQTTEGRHAGGGHCTRTLRAAQKGKARERKWETQPGRDVPTRDCRHLLGAGLSSLVHTHCPNPGLNIKRAEEARPYPSCKEAKQCLRTVPKVTLHLVPQKLHRDSKR